MSFSITVTISANCTVYARLYDGTNSGSNASVAITYIDTTAPTSSITIDDTGSSTIDVTVTASDSQSGVAKYIFQLSTDGSTWSSKKTVSTTDTTYSYQYTGLSTKTTYYVRALVYDAAGNNKSSGNKSTTTADGAVSGETLTIAVSDLKKSLSENSSSTSGYSQTYTADISGGGETLTAGEKYVTVNYDCTISYSVTLVLENEDNSSGTQYGYAYGEAELLTAYAGSSYYAKHTISCSRYSGDDKTSTVTEEGSFSVEAGDIIASYAYVSISVNGIRAFLDVTWTLTVE